MIRRLRQKVRFLQKWFNENSGFATFLIFAATAAAVPPFALLGPTYGFVVCGFVSLLGTVATLALVPEHPSNEKTESNPAPPKALPGRLDSSALVVGIFEYPPLSRWPDADGPPQGPWVLLAQRVVEFLDRHIVFQPISPAELLDDRGQAFDFVAGVFSTTRRERRFTFSRPFHQIGLQGICRANEQVDVLSKIRSGRARVVVNEGEVGWEYAQDELEGVWKAGQIAVLEARKVVDTMGLVLAGTFDVALADELSCRNFLQQDKDHRFRLAFDAPLETYRVCLALTPRLAPYVHEINRAVSFVRNTPEFLDGEALALSGLESVVTKRGLSTSTQ